MKAVVWTGPRQMVFQDVAAPQPAAGEVQLRVEAVGICGSELSGYLGESSLRVPPLIMGHEFSGQVASLGEGVNRLQIGDRVVVNPLLTCGRCPLCRMGRESLCAKRQIIGIHRPGAFAEMVTVPAANCFTLPDGLSPLAGSLAEPLACGVRAARIGGVSAGSQVMVIGAGTIGLMCIAAVHQAGGRVTLVTEVNPDRLATSVDWGAESTCDPQAADPVEMARQLTGGLGVDVAIDAVGRATTRTAAVYAVRPGGTVILVGLHEAESPLAANYVIRSEIVVAGSFAYTPADFARALELLEAGHVKTQGSWIEERELRSCADAFAQLVDDPPAAAKITLRP